MQDQVGELLHHADLLEGLKPDPATVPTSHDTLRVFPPCDKLLKVSRDGRTLEASAWFSSNETFTAAAVDMAKNLRWNPAQRHGKAVEAWVLWEFHPPRDTRPVPVAGSASGFITVTVTGGASVVYIDNVHVGKTPLIKYKVKAGQHTIGVRL